MGEWVKELETVIITQEKATDLTTATRLYQKHKVHFKKRLSKP